MPDLSSNAATFRQGNHRYKGWLAVFPRALVMSRAVNMASITYPVKTITFDNPYGGSGVYTSVVFGQTVQIYDGNTDTLKGTLRVAIGGSSSTVLQVNEFSRGTLDLADNDRIEVYAEFRIWDELVSATASFLKDSRLAYSDQNANPPPVCNSGGPFVGFADRSTGYLSVDFTGDTSFTVDPDSSGALTHSWSFPGATPSTSATANPTGILFPASDSAYLCTHTVTDSSNSKTQTQYIVGRVYDDAHLPIHCAVTDEQWNEDPGDWSFSFEIANDDVGLDTLPDGSFVVYFEQETYNGGPGSYGSNVSGRSNIKFAGYLGSDSVHVDADSDSVTFNATGPLSMLDRIGALPQILTYTSAPTTWQQFRSLTVWRWMWYLLWWGSTALLSHDFLWPDGSDMAYYQLVVQDQATITAQLKDMAQGLGLKFSADRLGRLILRRDLAYMSIAERQNRTQTYAATTADVMSVDMDTQHRRSTKTVTGEGITAETSVATQKPVFSIAPGTAPGDGSGTEALTRQVVVDQDELNRRTGDHYAKVNGLWWDEDTGEIRIVPMGTRLKFPSGYDIFDGGLVEYISFELAASTNKRGRSFSANERHTLKQISITHQDNGAKEVEAVVNHETHGPPAEIDLSRATAGVHTGTTPPPGGDVTNPGEGTYTPPTVGILWNPGANVLAVFTPTGVWITRDFQTPDSAGGPTWTFTTLAYGGGQSARSFVVDALSPKYLGTGTQVNGWVRTATRVYRVTDIFGTIAVSSEVTFTGSQADWAIDFAYAAGGPGLWGVSAWLATNQIVASYTTNGGVAWSAQAAITVNTMIISLDTGLVISPNTGIAYASAVNGSGASDIYKIDPVGLAWTSHLAIGSTNSIGAIALPFFNNAADTFLYYHKRTSTSPLNGDHLMRYDGSTHTDISPVVAGVNYCPLVNESVNQSSRWKISFPSNSRAKMLMIAQSSNGSGPSAVFATQNAEDASPTWVQVVAPGSSTYRFGALADDGQSAYLWGGSGGAPKITYHGNIWDGTAPDDRTGNMVDNAGQGTPLGICGG